MAGIVSRTTIGGCMRGPESSSHRGAEFQLGPSELAGPRGVRMRTNHSRCQPARTRRPPVQYRTRLQSPYRVRCDYQAGRSASERSQGISVRPYPVLCWVRSAAHAAGAKFLAPCDHPSLFAILKLWWKLWGLGRGSGGNWRASEYPPKSIHPL